MFYASLCEDLGIMSNVRVTRLGDTRRSHFANPDVAEASPTASLFQPLTCASLVSCWSVGRVSDGLQVAGRHAG